MGATLPLFGLTAARERRKLWLMRSMMEEANYTLGIRAP